MLGQSIWRLTTAVVQRSQREDGPGKNLPFSVEKKWRLLVVMTVFFGLGFAAPFFIVRHQLLKKSGSLSSSVKQMRRPTSENWI
ncbi:cytochrome c oxidase subunit 7C, mitochondrial-like [Echinops telfairi]|uniref:Cytochrome c oxidase subunit 7C, mitochondrial-like n=1 Tax=Echinops telfairi TaxID=9371 RepID=A0AC55D040_ECHTE|nr:cytochrome c oxidase subunit 7C, mitochondrial-like [Echinops telfairi]